MSALRLIQLGKCFGNVSALEDVSLELATGELLVVAGPSGGGKSTLLRLVAGLEAPSHGEIRLGAERFDTLPAERREVALIGQNPALLPQLTVAENLGLGLRLRKVARAEAERRVGAAAERLGIGGLLQRRPSELSGGEQQRVALGRVLVSRPKVLLLDEPLAQLDAELRRSLRGEIRRLQRELGVPALCVTHDQEEAMELGDRLALLRAGRLEQAGTPDELHRSPVNPFVAGFFSPAGINRLEGRLERDERGLWFRAADLRLRVPDTVGGSGADTRRLLMVRPESVRLFPSESSEMDRQEPAEGLMLEGTVVRVVQLGWERRIEIKTAERLWSARSIDQWPVAAGATVRWTIDWTAALWFPL